MNTTERKALTALLLIVFGGLVLWAAIAPGMQALIPLVLAVITGEALLIVHPELLPKD